MDKWFVIKYDYGWYCGKNMEAFRWGCPFRIIWTCKVEAESKGEAMVLAKQKRGF